MADDKKIIFSMVGVNKIFPPQKQVLKNIYLSFFYIEWNIIYCFLLFKIFTQILCLQHHFHLFYPSFYILFLTEI